MLLLSGGMLLKKISEKGGYFNTDFSKTNLINFYCLKSLFCGKSKAVGLISSTGGVLCNVVRLSLLFIIVLLFLLYLLRKEDLELC
jgi:hypothetical protein